MDEHLYNVGRLQIVQYYYRVDEFTMRNRKKKV